MNYKPEENKVIIHRPTLTESERKKREETVIKALERFGKVIEEQKSK